MVASPSSSPQETPENVTLYIRAVAKEAREKYGQALGAVPPLSVTGCAGSPWTKLEYKPGDVKTARKELRENSIFFYEEDSEEVQRAKENGMV